MNTLKLKRRFVFLALITAMLFVLTPSATVLAGEPGSGCGAEGETSWNGPPYSGLMTATRDEDLSVDVLFEVANNQCEMEFTWYIGLWPSAETCDEDGKKCVPGFNDLAGHNLRMLCFEAFDATACIGDDTFMQIIAASRLEYSEDGNSFTVNVVMMEVVVE